MIKTVGVGIPSYFKGEQEGDAAFGNHENVHELVSWNTSFTKNFLVSQVHETNFMRLASFMSFMKLISQELGISWLSWN